MKINTDKFRTILEKINLGSGKNSYHFYNRFIFYKDIIYAMNDHIVIYASGIEHGLNGIVDQNKLLYILNNIKDEYFDLDQNNSKIKIKAKKLKSNINIVTNLDNIPTFDDTINFIEWKEIDKNLIEGIIDCSFSTKKDFYNFASCICIRDNKVLSTDNHRLSVYEFKNSISDELLFENRNINKLSNMDNIKEYYIDNSFFFLKDSSGVIIMLRKSGYSFPKQEIVDKLFNSFVNNCIIIFPDDFIEKIKTIPSAFTDNKIAKVKIENKKLTIESSNSFRELLSMETEYNTDLTISFFVNIVEFMETININKSFSLNNDSSTGYVKKENFKHIFTLPGGGDKN